MELRKTVDKTSNKVVKRNTNYSLDTEDKIKNILEDESVNKTISELKLIKKSKAQEAKPKPENIHKDHRQRLKNQYLNNGFSSLTDVQKLELLLFYAIPQKDTNPIAHALLKEVGSLKEIFTSDAKVLTKVKGIKQSSATLLSLVGDMFNTISMPDEKEHVGTTSKAKEYCKKLYVGVEVEQFYVLCLTKANRVRKYKLIQTGTADELSIQIRSITAYAIENNCNRIIVSHNHPAGKGASSDEDIKFTYSLLCSCMLNSIEIVDHIIVGTDKTISMEGQNSLPNIKSYAYDKLKLSPEKRLFLSSLSEDYIVDDEN